MEIVQVLRTLGDKSRLRIVNILREGHLSVGEIEHILELTQSNVSKHLSKLKAAGIINQERRAQWIYYGLNNAIMDKYPLLRELLEKELDKIETCRQDLKKLREYRQRRKLSLET
ncbi:regulatory protein, arsR family [Thermosyntropha lipolytica DSM 11003]|uniref:Regulatory protein, arsR family n=1 Tax=Thermosyntropha lipolytica DSM 11003 TaxID=1123382 RepID=A0A1M5RVW6_9FIRM|nr:metalloregulator ArsR/SmtB family transcription factor [Thermosyntropha lipolytica]SHH30445.1 regulatory protein, arsR family [Thermosyntropha lipolytica DSM 11003]